MSWQVHKFGGTSLSDAQQYRRVAAIVADWKQPWAVVVSAMGGVTDGLLGLLDSAEAGFDYEPAWVALRGRVDGAFEELLQTVPPALTREFSDIDDLLRSAALVKASGEPMRDLVSGLGEVWSARLLSAWLQSQGMDVTMIDARDVLVAERGELGTRIDWEASASAFGAARSGVQCMVVTGYVARTAAGKVTTLGRNGSDYSAAIFARLLDADELHIWTDVDGVMSADPRLVPDAQVLDEVSYDEAMELAYFGAKVIHPQTLTPVVEKKIPVYIRNTFNPSGRGTRIGPRAKSRFQIKGITAVNGMALVNLEGAGMVGVPGTARRVFAALKRGAISVVMISQASSEHSICFVVKAASAATAKRLIEDEFEEELRVGHIQRIAVADQCSVLAAVGDAMAGHPGIAARYFNALSNAGVNVRAIAQGSSERNISAVIPEADVRRAIRAAHAAFYLSPQTLSVGIVGVGHVGGALLRQLASEGDRLRQKGVDLRVRAIGNSRAMLLDDGPLDLTTWRQRLLDDAVSFDLDRFTRHVQAEHLPHTVLIDCTAAESVAQQHRRWLAAGIHVVTPNKKARASGVSDYQALEAARKSGNTHYLYETTVGAGLPIIQTLRDLRETGDRVRAIEGMLSGTLAYLFNRYDGTRAFSALVREAWEKGYTEPDPRDDLSGMDVARKLVILARELGYQLEVDQLALSSLVPDHLRDVSIEGFVAGLACVDELMATRYAAAKAEGGVLRYVGRLDGQGNAEVGLEVLPESHAFAHTALTDNVVRFVSDRYADNPLVVQGPGAGPEVTAAGVFADLLRLCTALGARL